MMGSPLQCGTSSGLIQIQNVPKEADLVPSRFNARTIAADGSLVLYNSYSGAFTGFPAAVANYVEARLHKAGFKGRLEGLTQHLHERGYLVPRGTNELDRVRILFGQQQYRPDNLELILLTSEVCNFRFICCYETFPRGTMEPWVRESVVKLLTKRAPLLNSFHVSYFGDEPLLGLEAIAEMAPAFVRICNENEIQFSCNMTTNGYLLTADVFSQLLEWRINTFQITIDGTPDGS